MKLRPLVISAILLGGLILTSYAFSRSSRSTAEVQEVDTLRKDLRTRQSESPESGTSIARLGVDVNPVSGAAPEVILDQQQQQRIWDLEHYTFELEWKFGKLVKDAIRTNNRIQLANCFLAGSLGEIPDRSGEEVIAGPWWRQHELNNGHSQVRQATGSETVDFLLELGRRFSEVEGVGLRILQIDQQEDADNAFHLTVLLTLKGIDDNGPASLSSKHQLTVMFDNDQDIVEGQIIRKWSVLSLTYQHADQELFAERTASVGLDKLELPDNWTLAPGTQPDTYTCQTAVADFDRDGFLDIAVSSLQGKQYLLRSIGGTAFEDVTKRVGLPATRFFSYTTFATWIDYDNDDFPDLLIGKNLYHNDQGKRFSRVTSASGLKLEAATMGAVVADYDCDGWLDLYVLNHLGDRGEHTIGFVDDDAVSGVKNQLWRNLGNGSFEDVTVDAGVDGGARHSFAGAWFFANDDRFPDLYLVNDFGRNCLFINRGDGKFDEIAQQADVGDFANSMGVAAGDLDNDGKNEIYVANMFSKMGRRIIGHVHEDQYPEGVFRGIQGACAGSHLYKRDADAQSYREISVEKHVNEIGWAYAPVMADFDADGLLDIYATTGFISVDRRKPDG